MEVVISKRFFKELKKCPSNIQKQVRTLVETGERVNSIEEIPDIKKMAGFQDYYRIRLGNWRIGVKYEQGVLKILYLLTIRSRGDIYKHFPPK